MWRRIYIVASAAALICGLGLSLAWVYSHQRLWWYDLIQGTDRWALFSLNGQVAFRWNHGFTGKWSDGHVIRDDYDFPRKLLDPNWRDQPALQNMAQSCSRHFLGFGFDRDVYRLGNIHRKQVFIAVPYAGLTFLAACASMPFLIAVRDWRRDRYRTKHGLCPHCGYDLRASKDRCPECGREIATAASSGLSRE